MLIKQSAKTNRVHNSHQFEIYSIETFLHQGLGGNSSFLFDESYSMIWVQHGSGELTIDLQNFEVGTDEIYYIKPGQTFGLRLSDDAQGVVIFFTREFVELYENKVAEIINNALFSHFWKMPVIGISNEMRSFLKNIADEMLVEFSNYTHMKLYMLKGLLNIFIIYLSKQFDNLNCSSFQSRKAELVNNFYTLLEKNFTSKKQVREYASMLAVTPNYLNDSVKEISGFTVSHLIQKRIILEAKRRAIFEGYSLKEIAYNLGFWDPAHFSKYFKNSSGVKFSDFKKGVSDFC